MGGAGCRSQPSATGRLRGEDQIMGWTRNVLRVNLTEGTCEKEPLNMEWAQAYLGQRGLASKYLVEEVDPRVEPLSPRQQAHHGDGTADRHHGLHRRSLLGGDQEPVDRSHRLLELRRLHRRGDEERRLGHDHLRGQGSLAGLSLRGERERGAALRRRPLGQVGVGRSTSCSMRSTRTLGFASHASAGRRSPAASTPRWSTTCIAPRGAPASAP